MRKAWPCLLAAWCAAGVLVGCWLGAPSSRHGVGRPFRTLPDPALLRSLFAFRGSDTFPFALLIAAASAFVFYVVGHATTRRPGSPPLTWFDLVIAGVAVTAVSSLAYFAAGGRFS